MKLNQELDLMIQRFVDAGSFINDITHAASKETLAEKTKVDAFKSLMEVSDKLRCNFCNV